MASVTVRVALVAAMSLSPLSDVYAQPQPNPPGPPSAKECSDLINRASNDNLRKTMTKEQLDRTTVCLGLLKKSQAPDIPGGAIKIFRN